MRDEQQRREAAERHKKMVEHHLDKPPLQTGRAAESQADREDAAMGPDLRTADREMAGWLYVLLIALIIAIGATVLWLFIGPWQQAHPIEESERVLPTAPGEGPALAVRGEQFATRPGHDRADV